MTHGDAREGKWRGNWRMQWVASTLHTTLEHDVSSITTADAHTSAASSRLNWRAPADLNRLVRVARKTKYGFCACAITFQLASTARSQHILSLHIIQIWASGVNCECVAYSSIVNYNYVSLYSKCTLLSAVLYKTDQPRGLEVRVSAY